MAWEFIDALSDRLEHLLDEEAAHRIDTIIRRQKNNFGVDHFGFDPNTLKSIAPIFLWLYKNYFRVETHGTKNIPQEPMMIIANHSGQLPFDGAMIVTSFLMEPEEPIFLRGMVERWTAELPFISTFLSRAGQVIGTPDTCKTLLKQKQNVIVFPEGVGGIAKLFSERYKLADFGSGFMRIALAAKVPIVPVAVIGAEEQAPSIANFSHVGKNLGMPALPIIFPQILPLPLPVKYRLHIGEPQIFSGDGTEDDEIIKNFVQKTKNYLQELVNQGLESRKHIFF